jgi:hypothetical protein
MLPFSPQRSAITRVSQKRTKKFLPYFSYYLFNASPFYSQIGLLVNGFAVHAPTKIKCSPKLKDKNFNLGFHTTPSASV